MASRARVWTRWTFAVAAGAGLLVLSAQQLPLWPQRWVVTAPLWLVLAVLLFVPYAIVRAARLGALLDPLVQRSGALRFERRWLLGSGFVSFFVLLALPLKLGELSRPLLLARGEQPGVGMPEAIAAVATERLIDGLIICGLLFGGLAVAAPSPELLGDTRLLGRAMLAVFACGLGALVLLARVPSAAGALVIRVFGASRLARGAADLLTRVGCGLSPLLQGHVRWRVLSSSLFYWGITVLQLACVLRAVGLPLGLPEAAVIVALVGLSIQLPGGPAQLGTFQVGVAMGLGLFVAGSALEDAGATFAVTMYLLQTLGTAAFAIVGMWMLRRAKLDRHIG